MLMCLKRAEFAHVFLTWCGWDSQDVFAVLGELGRSVRSVFSVERLVSFTENNLPEVHQTCGQEQTHIYFCKNVKQLRKAVSSSEECYELILLLK